MIMGWSSLLDTTTLTIVPNDASTLSKVQEVAKMLGHRAPQRCTIAIVRKLMNLVALARRLSRQDQGS